MLTKLEQYFEFPLLRHYFLEDIFQTDSNFISYYKK